MAARRLLIVMLVLLGISVLATVLAPPRPSDSGKEATTTAKQPPPPIEQVGADEGRLLKATIDADAAQRSVIPLRVGDQISLRVRSRRADQVEIPAFGQIEAVSRDAPASFDLLLEEQGSYAVNLVEAGRTVGRLEVSEARPGEASGKGSGRRGQP